MIEEDVHFIVSHLGHRWKMEGGGQIEPSKENVREAIDTLKSMLYDEPMGSTVSAVGLMIEKVETGFMIYVQIGEGE